MDSKLSSNRKLGSSWSFKKKLIIGLISISSVVAFTIALVAAYYIQRSQVVANALKGEIELLHKQSPKQPTKALPMEQLYAKVLNKTIAEAMACENAVIASDVGETRKIVTETEGVLVRLNAGKIAQALVKLLADNDTLLHKGQSAREKIMQEHSIEKFTDYLLELMN